MADKLTPQQEIAVKNRGGKLLVSAAAGSGKTKVLVDRLLSYLTDSSDPANLDEFLIITYTKAAASELRGKIAEKLTERIAQEPENMHLQKQMQRLYLTKISTVHGFCSDILREYSYKLDLPADFRVADENECIQIRQEVMAQLLDESYEKAEEKQNVLPDLQEGQTIRVSAVTVKEGQTTPPKHHTEDTLLSAMETAGDTPENAERRGLGTPATRAGIIEKLVASGLVERKTAKKLTTLCPSTQGTSLITVLPEQLQSPQLTAQWEQELLAIQSGTQEPESFMEGICAMLQEMFMEYAPVKGAEILFPSAENTVGNCPRCGQRVTESPKGFFCSNRDCCFAIWKNNHFFTAKKKEITPQIAASFLEKGEALLQGCYSEKTGKSYDAKAVMEDDGQQTHFRLVFAHE